MKRFFQNFHLSWSSFLDYLPALMGGIICFSLTLFLSNFVAKIVSKYSLRRTKDTLIANFIGKAAWFIVFIMGSVLTLGVLGLGTISNKILAGAGITTFVIGFALKDIGENFLSGLILAFSRPYRVGSLIECSGVKGVVQDMTMRQTTVVTETGRITFIPNSMIINNPLIKYSHSENNLRQEFTISVESKRSEDVIPLIRNTINSFSFVLKDSAWPVKIIVDSLNGDKIKLLVMYWLDKNIFKGSRSETRSQVVLAVIKKLNEQGIVFTG